MADIQLEIKNLCKVFDPGLFEQKREVLTGLSLDVYQGEIFGFLGTNGAGKTTTIKAITGLITPDSGSISICGHPHCSLEAKRRLGFMPESPYFYKHLKGREFLRFYAQLLGIQRAGLEKRVADILGLVRMEEHADRPMRTYSKGMLQRVGLGQALLGQPELLILDEPMSGLDPLGRRLVRDVILQQCDRGATIFFSSHILPDVESICNRVAILAGGRVAAVGAVKEILAREADSYEITFTGHDVEHIEVPLETFNRGADATWVRVAAEHRDSLIRELVTADVHLVSITPLRSSLEDFMVSFSDGEQT